MSQFKTRPLFLVKPQSISPADIKRAERLAGICIIECVDPEAARLLEPPLDADMDRQARAALALMRYVASYKAENNNHFTVGTLQKFILDVLVKESQPSKVPVIKKK